MSDSLRVEVIARDFNRMLEELAAIDPKIEFRDVVRGVAERVVRSALRSTRDAKANRIRADFSGREYTTFQGKRYRLLNRYPDRLWREIAAFRQTRLQVKLEARGLSKKSWLHVGNSFCAQLGAAVPGYVAAANYKGREYPQDGESTETGSSNDYALTIINSSPIVQAAGGRTALLRAMNGETAYFRKNMETRAFRTFESRVAKYQQVFARNNNS